VSAEEVIILLREIGLPCRKVNWIAQSFFPNVSISEGELYCTSEVLLSDLLHEAGHIATAPSELRPALEGDLEKIEWDGDSVEWDPRFMYWNDQAASGWMFFVAKQWGLDLVSLFEPAFDDRGLDILASMEAGVNNPMGSVFSCQLFYAGMLTGKGAGTLKQFLQT
jgi:hypothetical protein